MVCGCLGTSKSAGWSRPQGSGYFHPAWINFSSVATGVPWYDMEVARLTNPWSWISPGGWEVHGNFFLLYLAHLVSEPLSMPRITELSGTLTWKSLGEEPISLWSNLWDSFREVDWSRNFNYYLSQKVATGFSFPFKLGLFQCILGPMQSHAREMSSLPNKRTFDSIMIYLLLLIPLKVSERREMVVSVFPEPKLLSRMTLGGKRRKSYEA